MWIIACANHTRSTGIFLQTPWRSADGEQAVRVLICTHANQGGLPDQAQRWIGLTFKPTGQPFPRRNNMLQTIKNITSITVLLCALISGIALAAEPVNINFASAEEIALNVKGIGSSKAAAIVAYRDQNGPFAHVDELVNVKGIGLATIDKNREVLLVSDQQ
jgi:competence protein ComEA